MRVDGLEDTHVQDKNNKVWTHTHTCIHTGAHTHTLFMHTLFVLHSYTYYVDKPTPTHTLKCKTPSFHSEA